MSIVKWVLDPTHSELSFKVKHLMISNVKGEFTKFESTINGEDFTQSSVELIINVDSINTNNPERDNHLKSKDFFDVENYKIFSFFGKSLQKVGENNFSLIGILTIKDVSKEVIMEVNFGGANKDPWGNEKIAFEVNSVINRKDFNFTWNTALETGGLLLGDEVNIHGEFQYIKEQIS